MSNHYMPYVLASTTPSPSLWNFYRSHEDAIADMPRANTGSTVYEPMTADEFEAAKRQHYIDTPGVPTA